MDNELFEYKSRSVGAWLKAVADGSVVLPTFQRSYVWKEKDKVGNYLTALLQERPTGVFLVLKADDKLQFRSRRLIGAEACESGVVREQILDGQQRLTSLWQAINDLRKETYYLKLDEVTGFEDIRLRHAEVTWPRTPKDRNAWQNPKEAFAAGVIPLSILMEPNLLDSGNRIWNWCLKVYPDDAANQARELENTITNRIRREFLDRRMIHYCALHASTPRKDAINIFIQSNQSSVRVTEFDIAVALATDGSGEGEDLRDRIAAFNQNSPATRHYLRVPNSEAAISDLGHSMLMAGCLSHLKGVPRKSRFEELIAKIIETEGAIGDNLDEFLKSVESALKIHANYGAPTLSTLPTWPSVHVLAGLDKSLEANPPGSQRRINQLISAYIWRAFATDRYDYQANDRLYKDFKGLSECLDAIGQSRSLEQADLPPIFDDGQHPVLTEDKLGSLEEGRTLGWIKTSSQGRSIAALTLHLRAIDWATGYEFTNDRVRDLESKSDLDCHHVFPKALLKGEGFSNEQINHGLNGVLLSTYSNKSFAKADPREYLKELLKDEHCPSEDRLKRWVESHLVPYDVLMSEESVKSRYRKFIKERACRVAEKFRDRTQSPV